MAADETPLDSILGAEPAPEVESDPVANMPDAKVEYADFHHLRGFMVESADTNSIKLSNGTVIVAYKGKLVRVV